MGDRGNIVIRTSGKDLFLYTHWNGSGLGRLAHKALAKKWRWNDSSYLARIVFETMIERSRDTETGFGISGNGPPDNEHSFLVIDVDNQRVLRCSADDIGKEEEGWTFDEFIENAPIEEWQ